MTLPTTATEITYAAGATRSVGRVTHLEPLADGRTAVLLDRTCAHPVDASWPDQPADRGVVLRVGGAEVAVDDVVTAGAHAGELFVGDALPVRMGTEGWVFAVAHLVAADALPEALVEGAEAEVAVDAEHRAALSAGHTACHLASLALDAALADRWTKPAPTDALGSPGFDAAAIETSRIVLHGSVDVYRMGKSLRRKGFPGLAEADLAAVAERANALLAEWVAAGGAVRIAATGPGISDRRTWECALPEQTVQIPCGGTHATSLAELGAIAVSFELADAGSATELTMRTVVG